MANAQVNTKSTTRDLNKTGKNNIAILDSLGFYGIGLRQAILNSADFSGYEIVVFKTAQEFMDAPNTMFSVVVVDSEFRDMTPTELQTLLSKGNTGSELLIMVNHASDPVLGEIIGNGIKGIINKDCEIEELQFAIRQLQNGKSYYDADTLLTYMREHSSGARVPIPEDLELEPIDIQMINLIADEYTQVEMNKILNLPTSTIMYLRRRLFAKLNVKNTAGMMRKALQYGIID